MSISRHHPKVGVAATTRKGNYRSGKQSTLLPPAQRQACSVCLKAPSTQPQSPLLCCPGKNPSPRFMACLPQPLPWACSSDLPSSPSLDSKYVGLQAYSKTSQQSSPPSPQVILDSQRGVPLLQQFFPSHLFSHVCIPVFLLLPSPHPTPRFQVGSHSSTCPSSQLRFWAVIMAMLPKTTPAPMMSEGATVS